MIEQPCATAHAPQPVPTLERDVGAPPDLGIQLLSFLYL